MNPYTCVFLAVACIASASDTSDTQPNHFLHVVSSTIRVNDDVFLIREEQAGGGDDSIWRFEDTISKGSKELATISGWRTASPLTSEWRICLVAAEEFMECLELTQTYPDVSGKSITLASNQLEPSTYGELEITH